MKITHVVIHEQTGVSSAHGSAEEAAAHIEECERIDPRTERRIVDVRPREVTRTYYEVRCDECEPDECEIASTRADADAMLEHHPGGTIRKVTRRRVVRP